MIPRIKLSKGVFSKPKKDNMILWRNQVIPATVGRCHFHSRSSRLGKRVRIRGRWRPPNTYIHQGRWRVHKFGEDHGSKFLNVFQVLSTGDLSRPILQLKKREVLLPLSFLITKPIKLDLWNLHYGPHYEPHYRTQGCVIRETNVTAPLQIPLRTPLRTL